MRRFAHYIKSNSHSESPRHILCFDTETRPQPLPDGSIRHRLWFGWACYLRSDGPGTWRAPQWQRFSSPRSFWRHTTDLIAEKTTLYAFCHNSNFDLPVLKTFGMLRAMGWKLTRAVIDAPPTIIVFRHGTRKLVLLDTLNWWRVPLADLGMSVGQPKLPMPSPEAPREDWDTYCRGDVAVLCKALTRWLDMLAGEDLGGFASTLAGQAMRTWRHRFMPAAVLIDTHENALEMARSAYLGGRTEMLRQGIIEGEVHCIDINSMYPAVMRDRPYPTRLVGVDTAFPEVSFAKFRAAHACIGEVLLDTKEPIYPRLIDGRLCFPVGQFWSHLAGPELGYAVDHGHVVRFRRLAVYHQEDLFTAYVDYFYAKRLAAKAAGDELTAYFLKIMMNSLYGKFGQRGRVWEEVGETDDLTSRCWVEYDVTSGIIRKCRQLAGLKQVKSEAGESAESMPAIAAYVTSYARLELYRLILMAGWEHVFYCDTDSLFVDATGLERLQPFLDPTALGKAKHVWTSQRVHLRGLKDYTVDDKVIIKGIRKNATWLTESECVQDGWSGLKGQLRLEDIDNAYLRPTRKALTREYAKGTIGADGWVRPLRLAES